MQIKYNMCVMHLVYVKSAAATVVNIDNHHFNVTESKKWSQFSLKLKLKTSVLSLLPFW